MSVISQTKWWLLLAMAAGFGACDGGEVAKALPQMSLYQLDHVLHDQDGKQRRLAEFTGEPVLIAMMFTNCPYACPALVADIKKIFDEVDPAQHLRVLLVSMDHVRDTPERLAAYAKEHGFDLERYTMLHASADAVAELAALLDVRYAMVDGGDFSHSNVITLLDPSGRVSYRQEGLGVEPGPFVAAIAELSLR